MATQTIILLHEVGHQAYNNGVPTVVLPDDGGGNPDAARQESLDNSANIGAACMPQGDFGGNQGPIDQPPTDVPAIAKPVKHHF